MQNPVRTIIQKFGWNAESEIQEVVDAREIEDMRKVCKLWIGGFATFATISGWGFIRSPMDISIEPENTVTHAIEIGFEVLGKSPMFLTAALSVSAIAEGVRMHRLASQRLDELSQE